MTLKAAIRSLATAMVLGFLVVSCGGPTTEPEPESVTDVTTTPGDGFITVAWSHPGTNVTGFEILRDQAGAGTLAAQQATIVATVGPEAREYVDDDIQLDTPYDYSVVAVGEGGKAEATGAAGGGVQVNGCYDPANEPIVDAVLADAIRGVLGLSSGPTCAELEDLTDLEASDRGISSLTGLQHAVNLLSLGLDNNEITSVAPLAGHPSLEALWLGGNQLADISPLAGVTQLTGISLWRNPLDSIEALRHMDGLTHAYVGDLGTTELDASPLSSKPELRHLHINNNGLTDLSFLADSVGLVELEAEVNDISDASILANMTGLMHLKLGRNDISDISFIDGLDQLVTFSIYQNPVTDHTPVHQHTTLEVLDLGRTGLTDISFLEDFTDLVHLDIYDNPITDISYVEGLTGLHGLDIGGTGVDDISFLVSFTNLENLGAWGNPISDISALEGLANLSGNIDLNSDNVAEIGPLVANAAIGEGSTVRVEWNCLDLTAGSQASQDVQALRDRGVEVFADDQRETCD